MCEQMENNSVKFKVLWQFEYFEHLFLVLKKCILNTQNSFSAPINILFCGIQGISCEVSFDYDNSNASRNAFEFSSKKK